MSLLLKDRVYTGELLNDMLDPTPVAVIGNMIGFVTSTGKSLAVGDKGAPKIAFGIVAISEVALPTGGVFAEAVHGQAVSAERIDLTRFWNWKDSPIPLMPTEIKPIDLSHTASNFDLTSGKLDTTSAPLQAVTQMPAPAGLADLLIMTEGASTMFGGLANGGGAAASEEAAPAEPDTGEETGGGADDEI